MDEAQITGSASSYARKYALCGLFLIDDGNDPDSYEKPKAQKKQEPKIEEKSPEQRIRDFFLKCDLDSKLEDKISDVKEFALSNNILEMFESMESEYFQKRNER